MTSLYNELTGSSDNKPKTLFQVTYRISKKSAAVQSGKTLPSDDRYDNLKHHLKSKAAQIYSHFVDPGHVSTSTWVLEHKHSVQDLYEELVPLIAVGYDMLRVVPISFGTAINAPDPINA